MESLQPHPPFRSFSTASSGSLNSVSTNITRVALGPLQAMNLNFNRLSSAEEHLYYQCVTLKEKLSKIEGMEPFLSSAFISAEDCAEQQSLALSQQSKAQANEGFANEYRSLVSSAGFSIHSDTLSNSPHHSINNGGINNTMLTFTAGILPANKSGDPVTQLWKLFQQGAPLCLIFNSIYLNYEIPIVASDDLRVCKKSVYDFLIAVKTHLDFDDDLMFTISNVFSDNTHDLIKIIKVIYKLLNLNKDPSDVTPSESDNSNPIPQLGELVITDDRSKVFKEIVETERKYVQDLELLLLYKNELLDAELISNEQIHILFPNLNEIIDFQRRFLNGLECNVNIPTKYQRIGSVFIHAASGPFSAYEPWTIGQLSAIDLINKEFQNLKKSSTLLDPGFELQSYIIKPIQRLCKYPLLLKELIKNSPEILVNSNDTISNELVMANQSMKEVANRVNEAQRRAENVGYLQSLVERVSNWRGFNLKDQGELLYHGIVGVKDAENEKEYVAYLFERIIFFFIETNLNGDNKNDLNKNKEKKKRELLSTRKKSSASVSSSTANLLESLNSAKDKTQLELKGRVYISEIYNISSSNNNGYTLVIAWSGKKESGSFTLRYRTEESRNQWENCLRNLKTNEMNNQIHKKLRDSHVSLSTNESGFDVTAAYQNISPSSNPLTTPTSNPGFNNISTGNSSNSNNNGVYNDPISFRSSNGSYHRHHSSSSTYSMMKQSRSKSISENPSTSVSRGSTNSFNNTSNTTLTNDSSFLSQGSGNNSPPIQINLIYNKIQISNDLLVPITIQFNELHSKISSAIASSNEIDDDILVSKLKYKDEDGDFVVMDSNDDWILAIDMLDELNEEKESNERNLTIWVS